MNSVTPERIKEAVTALCQAIDAGGVSPTEAEMVRLGMIAERYGGPFAHDLVCQLASRCRNGRAALAKASQ